MSAITGDVSLLPLLAGFGTGMALIAAIGAQNAFVLRQGIRREHVLAVVLVCAISDALLITAGVAGVGGLISQTPWIMTVARIGGAAFLLWYAFLAARRALRPHTLVVNSTATSSTPRSVLLTSLALTWLNPHVYLDTVVLLGSIAASYGLAERWIFGLGAVLASATWFSALGFGARLLRGFFTRPRSWQLLDGLVALIMVAVAVSLLRGL
jgi:L-lysine exporter family protein LysE/ArgO